MRIAEILEILKTKDLIDSRQLLIQAVPTNINLSEISIKKSSIALAGLGITTGLVAGFAIIPLNWTNSTGQTKQLGNNTYICLNKDTVYIFATDEEKCDVNVVYSYNMKSVKVVYDYKHNPIAKREVAFLFNNKKCGFYIPGLFDESFNEMKELLNKS